MYRNGADVCGVYVAGSYLLDMAEQERQVDVFHAVKQIRANRPQLINSLVSDINLLKTDISPLVNDINH